MLQSRLTVAGETFSTSAVSSALSPPKETHFDDLHFARIKASQLIQRFIERRKVARSIAGHDGDFVQSDMLYTTSALDVVATSMVDQYAPHHLRRNCEEVGAILPLHSLVVHQAHVRLVYQRGCLEGVVRPLALHVAVSEATKFIINDRCQTIQRALISRTPSTQELA